MITLRYVKTIKGFHSPQILLIIWIRLWIRKRRGNKDNKVMQKQKSNLQKPLGGRLAFLYCSYINYFGFPWNFSGFSPIPLTCSFSSWLAKEAAGESGKGGGMIVVLVKFDWAMFCLYFSVYKYNYWKKKKF